MSDDESEGATSEQLGEVAMRVLKCLKEKTPDAQKGRAQPGVVTRRVGGARDRSGQGHALEARRREIA